MKEDLRQIPVSYEEIKQFEPMIHKLIKEEILRYWGRYSGYDDGMIPRLGMSVEDLMQYGRMVVCEQIRWFKKHGDPKKSKMITMIYNRVRNKLISLSVSFCTSKRGGNIIDVAENRSALQSFINSFDHSLSVMENQRQLRTLLENSNPLRKRLDKDFKNNDALLKLLKKVVGDINLTSMVDFESVERALTSDTIPNPEESLMIKESIKEIMEGGGCRTSGLAIKLLVKAKEMGIKKDSIPDLLDISPATFSRIVSGKGRVARSVKARMERVFGESFGELMKLTPFLVE
jgi:hypothetical protein